MHKRCIKLKWVSSKVSKMYTTRCQLLPFASFHFPITFLNLIDFHINEFSQTATVFSFWAGGSPRVDQPWMALSQRLYVFQRSSALIQRTHKILAPVKAEQPSFSKNQLWNIAVQGLVSKLWNLGFSSLNITNHRWFSLIWFRYPHVQMRTPNCDNIVIIIGENLQQL